MASLRRKIGSPFWFACFVRPDGTRTQRSTKETKRDKAMKIAVEWEQAARQRYSEAQFRRVLSDIHTEIHGTPLECPSFATYSARWLANKTVEAKAVTASAYKMVARDFTTFLGDRAKQPLHYVTTSIIAEWRDGRAKKTTPATATNNLKILRVLFGSAWREGLIPDNPAAKVATLKSEAAERRPFTIPEIKAVLAVASAEWKGMVLAGLYTGQRLRDIALLTWANVDMGQGIIRLKTSKTGRSQILPIAAPLRAYLAGLDAGDKPRAPLFPEAHKIATENQASAQLSRQFSELLVDAGLAPEQTEAEKKHESTGKGRSARRERNGLSFHCLRHTATSLLKMAGVSEAVARDIIGHDSAAMSDHYTHTDEASKRAAVEKLPDVTKG